MFGISTIELLVILVIALVIIGPKKLPEVARTIGRGFSELRRAMDGVKDTVNINKAFDSMMKDEPKPSSGPKKNKEEAKQDEKEFKG
jgi:Tat protein translocase TatB subunit